MAGSFQLHMTEAQFEAAAASAKEHGLTLSPFGGSLPQAHGVQADYTVTKDGDDIVATVNVNKHPLFVTVGMVEDYVKKLLGLS
jgi:hypothetical protein